MTKYDIMCTSKRHGLRCERLTEHKGFHMANGEKGLVYWGIILATKKIATAPRCECGAVAIETITVQIGKHGNTKVELDLCEQCLKYEKEMQL